MLSAYYRCCCCCWKQWLPLRLIVRWFVRPETAWNSRFYLPLPSSCQSPLVFPAELKQMASHWLDKTTFKLPSTRLTLDGKIVSCKHAIIPLKLTSRTSLAHCWWYIIYGMLHSLSHRKAQHFFLLTGIIWKHWNDWCNSNLISALQQSYSRTDHKWLSYLFATSLYGTTTSVVPKQFYSLNLAIVMIWFYLLRIC